MTSFTITPTVNQAKEFMEIASDFGQPLELLREAISNAFDAKATRIRTLFSTELLKGVYVLKILIEDNGTGMDRNSLQAFFDLGNSPRHKEKLGSMAASGTWPIGEKGHGTKVYFNSSKITVDTQRDGRHYHAVLDDAYGTLSDGNIPEVTVEEREEQDHPDYSTRILVEGYNHNQTELFNHERIKDYIYWFTKFGSAEQRFGINDLASTELHLKGLDRQQPEVLHFGHPFPAESADLQALFDTFDERAVERFCKLYVFQGTLPKLPHFPYQAVFSVEGNRVKLDSNKMLRRQGKYVPPPGAYTVSERYGIWLCKDFIPVARKNNWVAERSEWTKYHAFVNSQDLRLTANRSNIDNTPSGILGAIQLTVERVFNERIKADPKYIKYQLEIENQQQYNNAEAEEPLAKPHF